MATTKKTTAKKATVAKKPAAKTVKNAVKKPAKRAVPKPAGKRMVASPSKKPLVYASEQQAFWMNNGQILNSLVALRDALDEIEHEVYSYHAGTAHNDFANWVSDVLGDQSCAKDLQKAKNPKSAKTVVVKHLKTYSI